MYSSQGVGSGLCIVRVVCATMQDLNPADSSTTGAITPSASPWAEKEKKFSSTKSHEETRRKGRGFHHGAHNAVGVIVGADYGDK